MGFKLNHVSKGGPSGDSKPYRTVFDLRHSILTYQGSNEFDHPNGDNENEMDTILLRLSMHSQRTFHIFPKVLLTFRQH